MAITSRTLSLALLVTSTAVAFNAVDTHGQDHGPTIAMPKGVSFVCSISFDKDTRRPARVEDSALPCLQQAAGILKQSTDRKLVLVAVSDRVKDHEEEENGMNRETEDETGLDIRFEDKAAYRAVNTKDYLVRWLGADPTRVIPTTNERRHAQQVRFYLVPGDANFTHNYLDTTPTNEEHCTIKPCYDNREEILTPQIRSKITDTSTPAAHPAKTISSLPKKETR